MRLMIKQWCFFCGVILFLITPFNLKAQRETLRFDHISPEDGLSSGFVQAILQDSQGFIWFGTRAGLNRYDGYTIIPYTYNPQNSNSLSGDNIASLYEDSSGILWIGTIGSGLNRFDPRTETFTRYQHDETDPTTLAHNDVDVIYEDTQQRLWIGTREGGLHLFNRESNTFTRYQPDLADPTTLSGPYISAIHEDALGKLWIATWDDGLNFFDPETNIFTRYQHDRTNLTSLSDNHVTSLAPAEGGLIWVGTLGGGLNLFNPANKTFTHYLAEDETPTHLSDNRIISLLADRNGALWIGTEAQGLNYFDPANKQFNIYRHDSSNPDSISHNSVYDMMQDNTGTVWFGTVGAGVNKYDPLSNRFQQYRHDPNNPNSPSDNLVLAFHEDKNGLIWLGTDTAGLNKFDPTTQTFTRYPFVRRELPDSETLSFKLSTDTVTSITEDAEGHLWIGTWNGGLNKFDPKSGIFTYYLANENNHPNALLNDNTVLSLHFDSQQILWMGMVRHGLNRFNPKTGQLTTYLADENDPNSLTDNTIPDIYEDANGILWLATRNGLTKFNPITETFTQYFPDENDPTKLSHSYVGAICDTKDGYLWLTTRGGGLNRFDPTTERFTRYQTTEGLPSNTVYNIQVGNNGNLWLSTTNGLSKFNPTTETFHNYDIEDGLLSNEFSWGGLKTEQGMLLFGGLNGFNMFQPELFPENMVPPPVRLTDFLLFNKSVPIESNGYLSQAVQYLNHITLNPKDNVFAFEFSALGYSQPEENQFAYKLEGFEDEWNYVDFNRRFANYNSLPPGDYIFRVRASNNDGLWDEHGIAFSLTVLPTWWQTWWFQSGMILGLIGTVSMLYKVRVNHVETRNRELEQRVVERTEDLRLAKELAELAQEKAEIANQAKSEFLSNMNHELRTPLNGILGYAQILKRKRNVETDIADGLTIIQQSGKHLLTLINDILDLAKIEARKLEIYPTFVQLPSFLEGVVGIVYMRAIEKDIIFNYEPHNIPKGILADEKRLRQILLNLLGNAIKFTHQGHVTLRVTALMQERIANRDNLLSAVNQDDPVTDMNDTVTAPHNLSQDSSPQPTVSLLRFEVIDTGVGIAPDQLEVIFEAFEQVGDHTARADGTGLGLAISKQLVSLMGGDLQVKSELNKGSTFWFEARFPIAEGDNHPSSEVAENLIVGYQGERLTVLIVDDNNSNRAVLRDILEPLDFAVIEAINGKEGVTQAQLHHPNLIITDLVMPIMNGFDLIQIVRNTPDIATTKIIVASASAFDPTQWQDATQMSEGFISKPIELNLLFDLMADCLSLKWIYETISSNKSANPSTEIIPPREDLQTLYELAKRGNMKRIKTWAEEMAQQNEQYMAFVTHILTLTKTYDSEEIIELVEKHL